MVVGGGENSYILTAVLGGTQGSRDWTTYGYLMLMTASRRGTEKTLSALSNRTSRNPGRGNSPYEWTPFPSLSINPAMLCYTFSETVCWQWLGTIILAR